MINYIPHKKDIVLNGENTIKQVLTNIITRRYSYIFTRYKITLSKKFKQSILNKPLFIDCLCLVAIDKIYLVEKQSKNFYLIYTEIKKVQK